VASGTIVGEIESTKSVGELFAPVDGTVAEINDAVVASPELVNSDPFGEGWLIKVTYSELPTFLSYAEYSAIVGE
jgi:glycine cleavage system H protein